MKALLFGLPVFASKRRIIAYARRQKMNIPRTLATVRKARLWIVLSILFIIPFIPWVLLTGEAFFLWNMPFVEKVVANNGYPAYKWFGTYLTFEQTEKVVILGAFILGTLLILEWITLISLKRQREKRWYNPLSASQEGVEMS